MVAELPLARYTFTFQTIDPLNLPAFADPLLSGLFGLALRRLSCINRDADCTSCPLHNQCDFFLLTRGAAPPAESSTGLAARMRDRPPPLIFRTPVRDFSLRIPAGRTFSTSLIVVGSGNNRLPAIIRALALAGDLGLGRKRTRFRLQEVTCSRPGELDFSIEQNSPQPPVPTPQPVPHPPQRVSVTLLSPWLLPHTKENSKPATTDTLLPRFLMQVVRRISLLQQCYGKENLQTDFSRLEQQANQLTPVDHAITTEPGYSYGKTHKRFLAVRGSFTLDMTSAAPFWPFLYTGQWLNIPKQASKGFGRYWLIGVTSQHHAINYDENKRTCP